MRDGTAETRLARPKFSEARTGTGGRKNHFPISADHEQDWQTCPVYAQCAKSDDCTVRAGLRHTVVCPDVTGRAKERMAQSKRARAGSLPIVG